MNGPAIGGSVVIAAFCGATFFVQIPCQSHDLDEESDHPHDGSNDQKDGFCIHPSIDQVPTDHIDEHRAGQLDADGQIRPGIVKG